MNDEVRISPLGGKVDGAAILLDNAMDDSQSESCPDANGFSGIERVENMRLNVEWDTATVIADLNAEALSRLV